MSSSRGTARCRGIGLVLGAGGVVGHAFHAGVLAAVAEATGWDPRDADVIVGTSAGSVVGALLRAGASAPDLAARATGAPVSAEGRRLIARADAAQQQPLRRSRRGRDRGGIPAMSAPGALVRAALAAVERAARARSPRRSLPEGRIPTELVAAGLRPLFDAWPDAPLWINAVAARHAAAASRSAATRVTDRSTVADAVAASCAIPAFFAPVVIDGVRYVDGGVHSPTNADLARRPRARPRRRQLADVDRRQRPARRRRSARASPGAVRARARGRARPPARARRCSRSNRPRPTSA